MSDFEKSIQDHINKINADMAYGVAVLRNGNIINVRKKFDELKYLYIVYNNLEKTNIEEFKLFLDKTKGCFDNGEAIFQIGDIQVLIDGTETKKNDKAGMNKINYTGFVNSIMNLQLQNSDEDEDFDINNQDDNNIT